MDRREENIDQLLQLLLGAIAGSLTEEEERRLEAWMKASPRNVALFHELRDENRLAALSREQRKFDATAAMQRVQAAYNRRRERSVFWRWLPYAAAILIAATAATWVFYGDQLTTGLPTANTKVHAEEILPGGNRATLTLADGRVINLDEAQAGIVVGDHLSYNDGSDITDAGKESLVADAMNLMVLSTPKGGTYQVTLPDGSKVWLNANSTLKYPSRFSHTERRVEVNGEAYFSVQADSKRPFRIASARQTVEVLGTEFNVFAYPDEAETETTLVEGKVKVTMSALTRSATRSDASSGVTKELAPGQQSVIGEAGFQVRTVDVTGAIAWREGAIHFTNKPFSAIMAEVSRWYDVTVVYQGAVPQVKLYGSINRGNNLSALLELLQASDVSYRLDGRTLTISDSK